MRFFTHFDLSHAMADFDNSVLQQEQDRMAHLETENQNLQNHFQQMTNEINILRNQVQQSSFQLPSPPHLLGPLPLVTSAPIVSVPNPHLCAYRLEPSCVYMHCDSSSPISVPF